MTEPLQLSPEIHPLAEKCLKRLEGVEEAFDAGAIDEAQLHPVKVDVVLRFFVGAFRAQVKVTQAAE